MAARAGLPASLLARIGVSRIGRLTGLDRTGVEVASAIRPGGHLVQVANGKGETLARAVAGAALEAAELWAAETVEPARLRFGSRRELEARGAEAWAPQRLGSAGHVVAPRLARPETRYSWVDGHDAATGEAIWVPAHAVFCPPSGAPLLGPSVIAWSSNGMGAHPERDRAVLHGLVEVVERDQLARAIPSGFTGRVLAERLLAPASLAAAPAVAARADALRAAGFDVHLLDLSGHVGLPVAAALLVDREEGPVPLTAGYAAGLTREEALSGALLEAAQSRLTDIHGAREDVVPAAAADVARLRRALARSRPGRAASALPSFPRVRTPRAGIALVLRRLAAAGHRRVAVVDLAPPGAGVHVVKAIVPGMSMSGLL